MATNVLSIPMEVYTTLQTYIIDEFREGYPTGLIPVENVNGEPYIHRVPYFGDLDVSEGVLDWDTEQARADKVLNYGDVKIAGRQMKLGFTQRDLRAQGMFVINSKISSIITKFLEEVDYAFWHGNYKKKVKLNAGILEQASDAGHLNIAGGDNVLDSAAELLNALTVMVKKVPVKFRANVPLVLMMDWGLYDRIALALIGTDTATTVLEVFKKAYPNVRIEINSSAVLASSDTEGTNSRMLIFCQHIDLIRNVKAKEVSPVGPAIVDLAAAIEQLWGTLFAPYVKDVTSVYYTDTTITFA